MNEWLNEWMAQNLQINTWSTAIYNVITSAVLKNSGWSMKSSMIQGITSNAELSTVPEDGLAPLGSGAFAGSVMTKFGSRI